jgi:hypothetical protein
MSSEENLNFDPFLDNPLLNPVITNREHIENYNNLYKNFKNVLEEHLKELMEEIPPDMNDEQLEDFMEDYLCRYDRIVNLVCGKETTSDILTNMAIRLAVYKNSVNEEEYKDRLHQAIVQFEEEMLFEDSS